MKIVKSHDDKMVEDEQELTPQVRFWAISPGEKAKLWVDFKSNNLIAIGWDKLGDLRQYSSKDDIRSKIVQLYGDETSITNDALACHQFAQVIQLGDYIFVKKGQSKVIALGKVVSEYQYDASRIEYRNIRHVEWISEGDWDMPEESRPPIKTLTDMTPYPIFVDSILSQAKVGHLGF